MSRHYIYETDDYGDTVGVRVFCSDYCARQDPDYDGWNGCHESAHDEQCDTCGEPIPADYEEN